MKRIAEEICQNNVAAGESSLKQWCGAIANAQCGMCGEFLCGECGQTCKECRDKCVHHIYCRSCLNRHSHEAAA